MIKAACQLMRFLLLCGSFGRVLILSPPRHQATNTVTESVVLPPLIGGVQYAPIHAAGPTNHASIATAMDGRDCRSPLGLVIPNLVYLAGLQWPTLIPVGK